MRNAMAVFAAMLTLAFVASFSMAKDAAETSGKQQTVTGILIDQACGGRMMKKADPEAAAAKHDKSCAVKASCEKSGYAVISGKQLLKFDANGNKLAKEFLAKTDKEDNLRVVVEGTEKDGHLEVTSLTAAPEK